MKPDGAIKLVSELLDLPLFDSEENYCGIVDDVEFEGAAGKPLKIKALLVGPGAYAGRVPAWAMKLVRLIGGNEMVRVPLGRVRTITSAVHLDCPAGDLGLNKAEARAGRLIPRKGAF